MAVSIAAVMRRVRNYFERERIDGTFTISGGVLEPMPDAPYIAISGSAWHDGVWPRDALDGAHDADDQLALETQTEQNETFDGKVWGLHPPADFLDLCEEIVAFDAKRPAGSPQSEKYGDYSYSMANANSYYAGSWEDVFSGQLAPFRRMFTEVDV